MTPVFEPIAGRYLNTRLLGREHRLYVEEAGQGRKSRGETSWKWQTGS